MRKRRALAVAAALAGAYLLFGVAVRADRVPPPPAAPGEVRGAWHVHTTRSDGRGTLAEVLAAARAAGLQFVVVTDHNVRTGDIEGWHDGVLVVEEVEASTRYGHVVALGVPRALTRRERDEDPLGAITALGGQAVLAHPLHPRRPFAGWGTGAWRGFEIVSNDTAWHALVHGHDWGKAAWAAALLPWDRARAVLALGDDLRDERARFDAELGAARAAGDRSPRVLLCSADAHGYPSYVAAFEAFSMRLPIALRGDAAEDVRAVRAALLDGRAACVMDARAAASRVSFAPAPGGAAFELSLEAPDLSRARFTLLRDGVTVAEAAAAPAAGRAVVRLPCPGGVCAPGVYRVEGAWDGRPWIFTNPVAIE